MHLFLGHLLKIATTGPSVEGRSVQQCTGVPFNAKCLSPRKSSLTESSQDISELAYFFEHMTTNTVTACSIRAVW